ncbi:COPI associated [Terfezia boudieri ATCC MYA-4762]|uniref:COPI associated n=1 Tax=Terfezia boudieri ATCC MYA-4762 TaxID=1051890 RepID=A0A3N4M2F1_9PEZI|nr:COPI associated [Terfezia boudieri ATCC MYA-4762]
MDTTNIFRLVNLAVAGLMVLGGIAQFFPLGIQSAIIGSYVCLFGAAVGLLEYQIPPAANHYGSFLFSFLGRGFFYIFIGSIIMHGLTLSYVAGGAIVFIGVVYAALNFVPSIEPPENMRDDWGAEQV